MSKQPSQTLTQLFNEYSGNPDVLPALIPLIYDELRRLASQQLQKNPAHTLNTTALVHEAYIRLSKQHDLKYENRNHFFAIAATTMRNIVVDYARRKHAKKRGRNLQKISLDDTAILSDDQSDALIELDTALSKLAKLDSRQCKIVELRYFAGLSIDETANVLSLSPTTIKREWTIAKAWLYHELHQET